MGSLAYLRIECQFWDTLLVWCFVFQDQAYFTVRRKRSGYPELLKEPLTVHLACGYNDELQGDKERYQFKSNARNPTIHPVVLYPNQNAVLFPVPISGASDPFNSGDSDELNKRSGSVRCSIIGAVYGLNPSPTTSGLPKYEDNIVDEEMLTATVTVSEHKSGNTLHSRMSSFLTNPNADDRISEIGVALYHTYFVGWYTGFIQMPFFSIQDLLSALPYTVPGAEAGSVIRSVKNQQKLRGSRLLASLFVDEHDARFDSEHFGFLTPKEARLKYRNNYNNRFEASIPSPKNS